MTLLSVLIFLGFKAILPDKIFPEVDTTNNKNIIIDDMMKAAMDAEKEGGAIADTTEIEPDPVAVNPIQGTDSTKTQTPTPTEVKEDSSVKDPTLSSGGYRNLSRFYAKLRKLETAKSGTVRIAYFGDSMTDGDLIVQDLRRDLQDEYGGEGVGFVAITSLSANGRYSVSHKYFKTWKTQTFLNTKKEPLSPYGISGQVFFGNDSTKSYWVKYKAQGIKHSTLLNKPTLLYGKANNEAGSIAIKTDGQDAVTKMLTPNKLLNTLKISDTNPKDLQVDFHHLDSIPVYGFNFDNGKGIHIDNYSLRGNSGLPLSVLNVPLMNAFDRALGGYDLVVLQYGANVLNDDVEGYGWYTRGMQKVVENLRQCFPNADILIISTADKSSKIEEEMKTSPAVALLLASQKKCALNTESGFINLYSLMGGNGSMIDWVAENNAGADYTHFTASGAKKIAKLIHKDLIKGYNLYKKNVPEETADEDSGEPEAIEQKANSTTTTN
nr:hypothetical protein [Dysgonomonas sp. 25]